MELVQAGYFDNIAIEAKMKHKKNFYGTFISWLCQTMEFEIISHAKEFFELRELRVGSNQFDGVMTERQTRFPLDTLLLDELSDYVHGKTSKRVKFVEKPMIAKEVKDIFPEIKRHGDWDLEIQQREGSVFV